MSPPCSTHARILLYEPRTEGHHLSWLRYITEDLLSAGFELVLALDQTRKARAQIQEQLPDLLPRVKTFAARDDSGWTGGSGGADTIAFCQQQSGVDHVFLCCIDEIASRCLRRAAFGVFPPVSLKGVIGGIYIRPRFLAERRFTPNHLLKKIGFARLLKGEWFRQILLLDEYLHAQLKLKHPRSPFYFLPDPSPRFGTLPKPEARAQLGVPQDAKVFLFFGGPYRRKGLDLAVNAMTQLPGDNRAFLLCLGQQPKDHFIAKSLDRLAQQRRACSISRYVSAAEVDLGFAACDAVLLPYRKHFGSSSVLSHAAAAGKPVIASDEELIGRRVREYNLGLLFPSGNARGLAECLEKMTVVSDQETACWEAAARKFAAGFSRDTFRLALLQSFSDCLKYSRDQKR